MGLQFITRKFEFDAAHRVMNERMKCFKLHGHRYVGELTFSFEQMQEIGYQIDFKEIKRIGCAWIDDNMDHSILLNPEDLELKKTSRMIGTEPYIMSLNGDGYCNPTAENIVKEIFLAMEILFEEYKGLKIHHIKLYETPNCWTDCFAESISVEEANNFKNKRMIEVRQYAYRKGVVEYDDRKLIQNK